MPTNQQNNKSGSQGGNRPNENERDRKTMSDTDRGQQGKTGLGRDQDNKLGDGSMGRNDNTRTGGDRSQR